MQKTKTILITGSHHTPAIELITQLKKDKNYNWKIAYISHLYPTETHIEKTILPKLKIDFYPLKSGKLHRRYLPYTIRDLPKIPLAIFKAYKLVKTIKPDITVSFGGYISVPVIIASAINKVPSITHEQTLTISLSTKINSFFANKIALSFPNTKHKLPKNKVVVTGNLLRREIFKTTSQKYQKLGKTPLIYVTGGNQGSKIINQNLSKILKNLNQKFTIIHQTGINKLKQINLSNYHPTQYVNLNDIGWILNRAQIIISRSGANICQEIIALKKNSILIPLFKSQQNEQLKNALWTKKQLPQKTIIIQQKNLNSSKLIQSIDKLSLNKHQQNPIPIQINFKLLKLIHELV
ncbi:glycosyltransferase [Patescibacteria group bacterium]|nr:glycosyltransferase [Patescibacteria group bacterium]MCG2701731.1 glycosyltransferase [Candidatus Parcubacteria bacterium]MBU4264636.1 glycosyltransferase [Patescibacteria group bacterium]MBU4390591.1 glycosyltransferase [Patescibacteria group bacterium]MBU4397206.1 glycosyltransferase [Patescibacteria group bacterium]